MAIIDGNIIISGLEPIEKIDAPGIYVGSLLHPPLTKQVVIIVTGNSPFLNCKILDYNHGNEYPSHELWKINKIHKIAWPK